MEGRSEGRRGVNTIRMRHVIPPDLGTVLKSISRDRKRKEGRRTHKPSSRRPSPPFPKTL